MVFVRYPSFKCGITPSIKSRIDPNNLTGTHKLLLTSARIFGFNIAGLHKTGSKVLRKSLQGQKRYERYAVPIWNPRRVYPFWRNTEKDEFLKLLRQAQILRMIMRGVKVGKRKGGTKVQLLNIFEKKGEKK